MDLVEEVLHRFESAAQKAERRIMRKGKSQSNVRRGERSDRGERLMDKIMTASKAKPLIKSPVKKPAPKAEKPDEPQIKPVPKDSAHG